MLLVSKNLTRQYVHIHCLKVRLRLPVHHAKIPPKRDPMWCDYLCRKVRKVWSHGIYRASALLRGNGKNCITLCSPNMYLFKQPLPRRRTTYAGRGFKLHVYTLLKNNNHGPHGFLTAISTTSVTFSQQCGRFLGYQNLLVWFRVSLRSPAKLVLTACRCKK